MKVADTAIGLCVKTKGASPKIKQSNTESNILHQ